jgi:hypothetical protein
MNVKLVALLAVVALAACARTAPIHNVTNAPIEPVANRTLTTTDVERAIHRAGAQLGWQMKTVKPGLIEATLNLRTHTAVVNIPFTERSYSILYKDSSNLQADGSVIHNNYNGWVSNLDRAIRTQLVS